jgi:hypothetical protein
MDWWIGLDINLKHTLSCDTSILTKYLQYGYIAFDVRIAYLTHHILTINHNIVVIIMRWNHSPSPLLVSSTVRYPHVICSQLSFYCRPTPGCNCLASSPPSPNSCCSVVPTQLHHNNHPTTESPQSSLWFSMSHLPQLLALLFIITNIKHHRPPPPLNVEAQYHFLCFVSHTLAGVWAGGAGSRRYFLPPN